MSLIVDPGFVGLIYPVGKAPVFVRPGHIVISFSRSNGSELPVYVDELEVANRLLAVSGWKPYPNRPGKERYLRRSIRAGDGTTTDYAHQFLFGPEAARPKDGSYFNLRRGNFVRTPRTKEEVSRLLTLIDDTVYVKLQNEARRELGDCLKADGAVGATVAQVLEELEAGENEFANDADFVNSVFSVLGKQINKRRGCLTGDITVEPEEREYRVIGNEDELLRNCPSNEPSTVNDEPSSAYVASSQSSDREDNRPARPKRVSHQD